MARPGDGFGEEAMLDALEARLGRPHERDRGHDGDERCRIDHRDDASADCGVDRRTDERRDQAEAFANALEDSVRFGKQLARKCRRQQRGPCGGRERSDGAREDRNGVEDPNVLPAMHEKERQDTNRLDRVRRDQKRPPPKTIDNHPGHRRKQRRKGKGEEHETGVRVAAGEGLRPDAEDDDHRPVAELRQRPAEEEDACVPNCENSAHQLGASALKPATSAGSSASSASGKP